MKLDLPVEVNTTFVHQSIYSSNAMTFLVIQMEAQEGNK